MNGDKRRQASSTINNDKRRLWIWLIAIAFIILFLVLILGRGAEELPPVPADTTAPGYQDTLDPESNNR